MSDSNKRNPRVHSGSINLPADLPALLAFLQDLGWLLPNETLDELPLRFSPKDEAQAQSLREAVECYAVIGGAVRPYEPDWTVELLPPKPKRAKKATQQDLLLDSGPEPKCCSGLCVLNGWTGRRQ